MNGSHDMTTPAFRQLIALDMPSHERTTPMTATTIGIDYHIQELQQVATDLRNERTFAPVRGSAPGRIRLAVGGALVQLGTAVAASNRRTTAQAR